MQGFIVAVIVACAAIHAVWRLLPAAGRRFLVGKLPEPLASRLQKRAGAGACGACDSCGGCAPGERPDETRTAKRVITLQR